ncbi:hypothetical protein GCM10009547_48960 [Sporichthya brevicatena]|uniref:Uncharacterized protein n=1 Tax=Sporichthya brevicatena TaxID=171442 RepID=A0ABN1HD55_9ACTN
MGMHSKPSRAALVAKTGACSGAALLLSASGILLAPPAGADGTPPGEAATTSAPPKAEKKSAKPADRPANVNSTGDPADDPEVEGADAPTDGPTVTVPRDRNINGVVNVADLNVQVVGQVCNNFVPVNVLGGQGAGEAVTGGLALLGDAAGANAENLKACEQVVDQTDGVGSENAADGAVGGTENVNGLINVTDNNVHVPVQVCNNYVPVNVLGGQGSGENATLAGALGILGGAPSAESTSESSKSCDQDAVQHDRDGGAGDRNTNGLINVTDNNVHVPLQGCNNYVPVNVLGGQGSGESVTGAGAFDLGGLLGEDDDPATAKADASNAKSCDQDADQHDDD